MDKPTFTFEDFLADVDPACIGFAVDINRSLLGEGYKSKIELKANGFLVSYTHPRSKRSILNFIFRKKALMVRVYADHCGNYAAFLHDLPDSMEQAIRRASNCKRLLNPQDCNSRCPTGYDFEIRGNRYQKCRYSCFQFPVTPETMAILSDFINYERKERSDPS